MNDTILTPEFARLADWSGIWAMEPRAFAAHAEAIRHVDLRLHMQQPVPEARSAIEKTPATRGGQGVAIVKVAGTMMKSQSSFGGTSTVQIRRDIRQATADPDIGGILLAIDSPGGTVAGTDDLAADVRAARRSKPVWAHIDDLGASAAYWVASQADQIYANSSTAMVGSIGTLMVVYDESEAFGKMGVRAFKFATGPLKGAGAMGTPITDEQAAYFQAMIDGSQQAFDAAVRRGRGLTDKQLADVRTGGVFLAEEAVRRKLIDGIRPLSKTLDEMARAISGRASKTNAIGALPMLHSGA